VPEVVFEVNARDLAGLREKLATGEFALVPAREFVKRSTNQIRTEIVARTPVGVSGNLKGRIATEFQDDGLTGIVGSNVGYAPHVEFGTRPHYPPLEGLLRWVQLKGLGGNFSVKTKRRLGNKFDRSVQDVAMARAIQRKIGRKGTKGHHMFRDGIAAAQPFIDAEAAFAMERMGKEWQR
jgi:hypothetical protein